MSTTRGGQITFHNIRMWWQVNVTTIKYVNIISGLLGLLATYLIASANTLTGAYYYTLFWLFNKLGFSLKRNVVVEWEGQRYSSTLGKQLENPTLAQCHQEFLQALFIGVVVYLVASTVLFVLVNNWFKKKGQEQSEDNHIRGFKLAEPKDVTAELRKKKKLSPFALDGHKLFVSQFEVKHLLIDGTTGAGKSVAIRKLLRWIRERGDKAIIYDKGCDFVSKFYDPHKDIILNPFDERCAAWDIWSDAKDAPEFESLAAALIPQHGEGDPFWVDSARTIFSATAYQMMLDDKHECSIENLLHIILTSELSTLGEHLKGTEASSLVSKSIEKTAISIKSVLATYIKSLRYLHGLDEKDSQGNRKRAPFSITDWVQDESQQGFLFLSSNARQHTALRPLISMWLAIASNAILGMEPDEDRRIWVIIDEMPTLHKLPELTHIISEVRKFGGCYLLGLQSYAQLETTYGRNAARVIFDLLNTRFFFRAPSKAMATVASDDLGEQEIDISRENISYGANALRDGVSLGHQNKTRPVVSPAEIQGLDDLECYLRTPNSMLITKLQLRYDRMSNIQPSFMKRNIPGGKEMERIDQALVFHELIALHELDETQRNRLLAIQQSTYENEAEQQQARENQKQTLTKAPKQEASDNQSQNQQLADNTQSELQRETEEASITQHDAGEMYDS
ncbi:type IV conjugative transfer system coupling protein TraD [Vibrio parahaemolyticus]|uniref:Type IV conjugative transfer system coupling protein TraD n=1 Tax=Vibrio parahaemolyticus TaxID=670 RepID=A0A9Q3UF93_VIBPH|nr:type IV conjugative transfer system coupling protein TraD [Vibrio parahaemolyticus]EGQ8101966.1 type IV conjugative transfer system coupling protein TraD [Vibrio parahaemolyticus]EGQ8548750.1 type IV conjugative transfer system coupling protein TraD [Vibrio parahaemolyticus]EGQ9073849.1 type IV conjugative transfer system coupling protein TraD [Vibrio parahaemolyticus]EGQ9129672.1 type IV conjugative transfer system coupling protein TraD [Vibrio parahaemolyticus]EGQ9286431.1 type IV conjuga